MAVFLSYDEHTPHPDTLLALSASDRFKADYPGLLLVEETLANAYCHDAFAHVSNPTDQEIHITADTKFGTATEYTQDEQTVAPETTTFQIRQVFDDSIPFGQGGRPRT